MSVDRALRKFAFLSICGLMLACPHRIPKPVDALQTPEEVLESVGARIKGVSSLALEARASVYDDGTARKGTLEIALERPASLLFAVLSPTGDMLSVLASDGVRFTSFERGGSTCVTGCSTPENIARLIPLALQGADAVSALLGVPPLISSESLALAWSEKEGTYVVTIKGTETEVQTLWIEHGTGIVRRSEVTKGGKSVMELSYEKTRRIAETWLPQRLRVTIEQGKTDMQLDYRDVELNPTTLTKEAFQVACPAGTQVQNLGCSEDAP